MKSLLFRRFICVALLVASSAAAEGVRFSEWQGVAPLQSFSPPSPNLSPALTNAERGLFQQGFIEGGVAAALLNPAVWAVVAVGAAVAVSAKIRSNRKSSAPTSPPLPAAQQACVDAVATSDLSLQNRVFAEPTGTFTIFRRFSSAGGRISTVITLSAPMLVGPESWRVQASNARFTSGEFGSQIYNDAGLSGSNVTDFYSGTPAAGSIVPEHLTSMNTPNIRLTVGATVRLQQFGGAAPASSANYLVYRQPQEGVADNNDSVNFYIADGVPANPSQTPPERACSLAAGQFFLDEIYVRTTVYATGNQFRERLRGVINESRAVRLGDFYFAADAQLNNIQLERRDALWLSEGFDLYSDSGYQRIGAEKTAVFYNKLTALQKLSETAEGYLQLSSGSVTSDKYRDSRLQGLALGIIAERVFRHDDTLHFRLERPTGDSRAKSWYAAANMQIGNAAAHWNFGIRQRLDKGTAEGGITYRREF